MIKLSLAARENEKRRRKEKRKKMKKITSIPRLSEHYVFSELFCFFVCSKRFTYNLKSFIKCEKFGLH